jgi:hypothetical protein
LPQTGLTRSHDGDHSIGKLDRYLLLEFGGPPHHRGESCDFGHVR